MIKSSVFVKYTVILLWSFQNDHFKISCIKCCLLIKYFWNHILSSFIKTTLCLFLRMLCLSYYTQLWVLHLTTSRVYQVCALMCLHIKIIKTTLNLFLRMFCHYYTQFWVRHLTTSRVWAFMCLHLIIFFKKNSKLCCRLWKC